MNRRFDKMTDAGPVDTKGQLIKTCIEHVWKDFSGHECGRKLKGDDEFPHLCGLHVSAIRRRQAKDTERRQRIREDMAAERAFDERVAKVAEPLGLKGHGWNFRSETVTVKITDLEQLIPQLRALQQSIVDYHGFLPEGEELIP